MNVFWQRETWLFLSNCQNRQYKTGAIISRFAVMLDYKYKYRNNVAPIFDAESLIRHNQSD